MIPRRGRSRLSSGDEEPATELTPEREDGAVDVQRKGAVGCACRDRRRRAGDEARFRKVAERRPVQLDFLLQTLESDCPAGFDVG